MNLWRGLTIQRRHQLRELARWATTPVYEKHTQPCLKNNNYARKPRNASPYPAAQAGELREINGRSGGENAAKGLKGRGVPFFPFVGTLIRLSCCPYQFHPWKLKTGDPNFRTAGKSFIAHSARLFTRPRAVLGQRIFESNKLTVADNYLPARST